MIDLANDKFWLIFAIALVAIPPIRSPFLRSWVWALVNIAFLHLLLSNVQLVATVAAIAVVWLLLNGVATASRKVPVASVLALLVLALYLAHKYVPPSAALPIAPTKSVLATIGFSFVALRLVDVIRSVYEARQPPPSLSGTINYLVPFHMLAAGPIQAYDEFVQQPAVSPRIAIPDVVGAAERIALGVFKKFVLALALQRIFLTNFQIRGWYFIVEVQLFYLWLYLDFSALSDIAVGVGKLLGVRTPENFNNPFVARNIINFWERWHITLSLFIRRHVFMPIQLSLVRKTKGQHALLCASVAFVVAFVFSGVWHGGTWRFVAWGFLHGLALMTVNAYRYYLSKRLGAAGLKRYLADRRIQALSTVVTFEFVAFSLLVFQTQ